MEKRINVAELLKNCPKGMELNCTTWENVTFEKVISNEIYIKRNNKDSTFDKIVILNLYGCTTFHKDEKCRIFPKGKTTWEGFLPPFKFKDGDIVAGENYACKYITIYKKFIDNTSFSHHVCLTSFGKFKVDDISDNANLRFATKEEKQKLFDTIKENGYKWNADTKTLEKLVEPRFKVGNRIKKKDSNEDIVLITDIADNYYIVETKYGMEVTISISIQNNYELVPNKFDITTLKSFESRVLVRSESGNLWKPAIFGCYVEDKYVPYYVLGGTCWSQCIPYEGNEHLRGKTDDCDEYYITWE